jgi:DNA-binding transcriptional ArsR family regulator
MSSAGGTGLDNIFSQGYRVGMLDVAVIDDPDAAMVALDPIKSRLLAELAAPASAATLAARVGLPRQKVNYHLRVLEASKLVEPAQERYWGGITERLMVATAASYVVSPAALGPVGADPARNSDRLSASYLIALAARIVREVGALWHRARATDKRLATLSIDTVIRFKSPEDRAAFTDDLSRAIADLAARYHDERAPRGRPHRLIVAAYPAPAERRH